MKKRLRMSDAKWRVLEFGSRKYQWLDIPRAADLPESHKRSFTRATLKSMERLGLIRFKSARLYITGKGRKLIRSRNKKTI
jgi:coproporphyrinogen III oxidase-like Fe-S oxidoreductase